MPILSLQKRARELGRIRIGQKGDRGQPQKLDRFRVTSASRPLMAKVAALYGGEVREWTPQGGAQQWEVITDARRMPILVPPQPVTQWLELWSGGGIVHRCDGVNNALTGEPCDLESKEHQDAKPTTRLNVILRDVEGIGVFRLESHGWNAAVELPDVAAFLAQAGGYVNGWLSLEERVSKTNGQTRRYIVPTIEIDVTPAQLLAGGGGVAAPSVEGPAQPKAIESGRPADDLADYMVAVAEAEDAEALMAVYEQAKAAGVLGGDVPKTHPLYVAISERHKALTADEGAGDEADPDAVWRQILERAGQLGMTQTQLNEEFAQANQGVVASAASAGELAAFLRTLQERAA